MSTHPVVQRGYDAEYKFGGMPGYAHDHSTGEKIDGHYFKDQKSADKYQKAYPEIVLANTDETGDLGRFAYSRHHEKEAAQLKAAELPTKGSRKLKEMYHGGTAGYPRVNKGDNIHRAAVMVHGTDGNRKVKKIHWTDTATFDGQVATPGDISKNDQVPNFAAKKQGWRLHQQFVDTNFDKLKKDVEDHHQKIQNNDKMLRQGLPESKNNIDSLVGRLFEKYVDNSN